MWKVDILSRARYRQNVPHVLFLGNSRKFDILNINLLEVLRNFLKGSKLGGIKFFFREMIHTFRFHFQKIYTLTLRDAFKEEM